MKGECITRDAADNCASRLRRAVPLARCGATQLAIVNATATIPGGVRVSEHVSLRTSDSWPAAADVTDFVDTLTIAEPIRRLRFDLAEMDVRWDAATGALWSYMAPSARPSFTLAMLRDLEAWQAETARAFAKPTGDDLRYLVLGSRFPGVFNLGGDLDYVSGRILERDAAALTAYGNACVGILYRNLHALDLPIVTIALIEGDCLGGGFESALSFNVLVAERGARFGFPETMFGMFPGVGAHSLLTRRVGAAHAERLMLSGETYTAEDMHALGLVHVLADHGQGEQAVIDYMRRNARNHGGQRGIYRAARAVHPVTPGELEGIVAIWVETALSLSPKDIKVMRRLLDAQARLFVPRPAHA